MATYDEGTREGKEKLRLLALHSFRTSAVIFNHQARQLAA